MDEIEDVEDILEFLTIFSLGDNINRKILKFLKEVSLNYAKSDNSKDHVGDDSSEESYSEDEGSAESDNSPDEVTDEYCDSDEENNL